MLATFSAKLNFAEKVASIKFSPCNNKFRFEILERSQIHVFRAMAAGKLVKRDDK